TSGPPACSCTGNWMPVLLSGGICVQSTLSSVSIEFGSFGYTSIASEFVPATSRPVTSKTRRAYAPATVADVATSVPLTHTSALPTTPLRTSFPFCPAGGAGKAVRFHPGNARGDGGGRSRGTGGRAGQTGLGHQCRDAERGGRDDQLLPSHDLNAPWRGRRSGASGRRRVMPLMPQMPLPSTAPDRVRDWHGTLYRA